MDPLGFVEGEPLFVGQALRNLPIPHVWVPIRRHLLSFWIGLHMVLEDVEQEIFSEGLASLDPDGDSRSDKNADDHEYGAQKDIVVV